LIGNEGALACSRRTGEADPMRSRPGAGASTREGEHELGRSALEEREGARQRPAIAGARARHQLPIRIGAGFHRLDSRLGMNIAREHSDAPDGRKPPKAAGR